MHPSNIKKPYGMDLKLSKFIYGTGNGVFTHKVDFLQYNAMKVALMSGGINCIDTASTFRKQKSEMTIGVLLRTLTEKYGYSRDEFFITTKHG